MHLAFYWFLAGYTWLPGVLARGVAVDTGWLGVPGLGRHGRRLLLAAVAVLALVVLVVVPAYVAYSSLHPESCRPVAPEGLSYEEFSVTAEDGVVIRGWVLGPGAGGDAVFVLMHGYTGCRSAPYVAVLARELVERGYPVVVFDFRGHGLSGGSTTIGPREVLDARAVVGYVSERFPGRRIVLVGFSMGGAVAVVEGAGDPRVYAVAADSPYYRLRDVIPRWLEYKTPLPGWVGVLAGFYGRLMAGVDLDFGPAGVERVDKPLLVVYGPWDPLVTRDEARDLAARSPCGRLVEVPGAGHVEAVDVLGPGRYADMLIELAHEECPPGAGG